MWLWRTIFGGPDVPEVKNISAGSVDKVFGPSNLTFSGTAFRAALRSITELVVWEVDSSNCITFFTFGHFDLTRWNFSTLMASPMKTVARVSWQRYSISLATRSVVAGQIMIPLRRAAIAISHLPVFSRHSWHFLHDNYHAGTRGNTMSITCPGVTPKFSKKTAVRWDCLWKCA
jgi:hypothetical protein